MLTELPFGQPGRIFRSPMPFGIYDQNGVVYETFRRHNISMIVLLAEDNECQEKAGRDLRQLYIQDGFKVLHLPIVDFGIPNFESLRGALDATAFEAQSGRHIASTVLPASEGRDFSQPVWQKGCFISRVNRPSNG